MKGRERLSAPAWNCFRAEFRRRWRGRKIAQALGWLILVAGLQFALALGVQQFSQRLWGGPGRYWLYPVMNAFSLYSPLAQTLAGSNRSASPGVQSYLLVQGIVAIPWLAYRFLLPAAAASSIAPDREQRRISELILAGLTPRQILAAKGLAAVLPLLAAALTSLIAALAAYPLMRGASSMTAGGLSLESLFLCEGAMFAIGLLLSAATQVCISAVSPRTSRAVATCYGYECLLLPVLNLAATAGWRWFPRSSLAAGLGAWELYYSILGPYLIVLFFQAVLFLLLWPRALRAVAYPDEVAASGPATDPDAS